MTRRIVTESDKSPALHFLTSGHHLRVIRLGPAPIEISAKAGEAAAV